MFLLLLQLLVGIVHYSQLLLIQLKYSRYGISVHCLVFFEWVIAASINPTNSGCGFDTVLLYSG